MTLLEPLFIVPIPISSENLKSHAEDIQKNLIKIIPPTALSDLQGWIQQALPLVHTSECGPLPDIATLTLLCPFKEGINCENFFYAMIKHGLLPENEATILNFRQMRFYFKEAHDTPLSFAEVTVFVENKQIQHQITERLEGLVLEIKNGVGSQAYANYLLSTKSFSRINKTSVIRNRLHQVIRRYPHHVSFGVFRELDRLFATSAKDFSILRMPYHIVKLTCLIHLLRKTIFQLAAFAPTGRHLKIKLMPVFLLYPFSKKSALGLLVGVRSQDNYELLTEEHIATAVQTIVPTAQIIKGSEYNASDGKEGIKILYVELEKKNGESFTLKERKSIQESLSKDLDRRIEKLVPALFMIRNEEEVLRNILTLSQEIHSIYDLPHVMLSLDRQTVNEVAFNIILIHVRRKKALQLKERFREIKGDFTFSPDRIQIVGYIHKKYPIEAHVFRLHMQKDPSFLRSDFSLNFYLARQKVVGILSQAIGEFRDFNGGIIVKQGEALIQLKAIFHEENEKYPDLLENLFYSLTPIEMQATLNVTILQGLFQACFAAIAANLEKRSSVWIKSEETDGDLYVAVRGKELSVKEAIDDVLENTQLRREEIIFTSADFQGSFLFGFLLKGVGEKEQKQFLSFLKTAIASWQEKITGQNILKMALPVQVSHLDPRLGVDDTSGSIIRLLFEGLTRIGKDGKVELGMAENVTISPDWKKYTFSLRKAVWTNGDPVTASDFEHAWKTVVSMPSQTFFSSLFSPIKNASEIKQKKLPLEALGAYAKDDHTLVVDLEHPAPYFLQLLAHTIFSPVHRATDLLYPHWPQQQGNAFVCNGAFSLRINHPDQGFKLVKNSLYWDSKNIELDQVIISRMSNPEGFQLLKKNEIDWVGFPLWRYDRNLRGGSEAQEMASPPVATFIWLFNTEKFPYHYPKLRKALSLALCRKELIKQFNYPADPAFSLLIPSHSQIGRVLEKEVEDTQKAHDFFSEALQELNLKKEAFPTLIISYPKGDDREIIASWTKDQWEKNLGIQCRLEPLEWPVLLKQLLTGDFQVSGVFWSPLIDDPIYTLNLFRYFTNTPDVRISGQSAFFDLLQLIDHETDLYKRQSYLRDAEEILISEAPVVPLFRTGYFALVKQHLVPSWNHKLGIVDIKWTRFSDRKN